MATGNQVSTSTEGMQAAGQEFVDAYGDFSLKLSNVNSDVYALSSSWTGQASTNFQNAMNNWSTAFSGIISQLGHMADVMGVSRAQYTAAEAQSVDDAGGFDKGLPHF
ncbi:WXG100 family type VII secretion target [Actinoplanes derwentensis]|uniref:ESAT-6-like protein n=1 Tax=Actinoplanes derwentensis TaxID=113562 RepID=A0A1H1XLY9_9ACTN|nr:WXG100 family type VII secretion target [Actinoplanes derwentensis]GID87739.1 hypothetical protein Ade03nite_66630 [Actinoplanes derwentensis]SDT10222.1 WXG100 family type VII secretion target [Actinoplanes derwentensis]